MKFMFGVLALAGLAAAVPEADPQYLVANQYLAAGAPYAANYAPYAPYAPYAATGYGLPYAAAPFAYGRYAARYAAPVAAARYAAPYAPAFYNYAGPTAKTVSSPVATVRSIDTAHPAVKAISPITGRFGEVIAQPIGLNHPSRCVSEGGCLVRSLLDAGLAKRSAESDPQFIAAAPAAVPYALSPYARSVYAGAALPYARNVYAGAYNALPYTAAYAGAYAAPYAAYNGYNAYATPYAAYSGYNAYAAPAVAVAAPAVAVAEPAVAVAEPVVAVAEPAVRTVVEPVVAPAPLPAVVAEPAVVAAPVPAVRAVAPVAVRTYARAPVAVQHQVEEHYTRPVTYEHLGAHPISPTTVLETDSRVRNVVSFV